MGNWNPMRRKPWKPKARKTRISMPWRRPKIRLDAAGMKQLRAFAFYRSGALCENAIDGERCANRIYWGSFHLAHMEGRGRGGSDVPENVLATCWDCHDEDTNNRRKLEPHSGWKATP
jgi:HNH endonuclease